MDYPYQSILINNREVSLPAIIQGNTTAFNQFEQNTFDFIQEWLNNKEEFIIQTSGSTGIPKQIKVTRSQMIRSAQMTGAALNLKQGFSALVCLDTQYIAGRMMIVRSFVLGMKIIAIDPSANPLSFLPEHLSIDFAAFVPYQIESMLESKHPHSIERVSTCLIGGGPLRHETEIKLSELNTRCFATYGMTETISHVALREISNTASGYYQTLPGIRVQTDSRGCLVIEAPFLNEPIVTNDLVELVSTDQFQWLGRWDNVVNSGGVKIPLELVEKEIGQIFTRSGYHQPFFLYGIADDRLGERLVLVVSSPPPASEVLDELAKQILNSFSSYHIPKELFEVSTLIFTPTGKIDRRASFNSSRRFAQLS